MKRTLDILNAKHRFPGRVIPRRFSASEDEVPYDRPQTPSEMADWLRANGRHLAPATAAVRRERPDAEWVCWRVECAGFPDDANWPLWGAVSARSVFELQERWGPIIAGCLLRRKFQDVLLPILEGGSPEQLDATREWLANPAVSNEGGVPAVLLKEDYRSLSDVLAWPPAWCKTMSPRQWRKGAMLWRSSASTPPSNLVNVALDIVAEAERARLKCFPCGKPTTSPARL